MQRCIKPIRTISINLFNKGFFLYCPKKKKEQFLNLQWFLKFKRVPSGHLRIMLGRRSRHLACWSSQLEHKILFSHLVCPGSWPYNMFDYNQHSVDLMAKW